MVDQHVSKKNSLLILLGSYDDVHRALVPQARERQIFLDNEWNIFSSKILPHLEAKKDYTLIYPGQSSIFLKKFF